MYTEASTILRAVAVDFFFNCWCVEIPWDNCILHAQRCIHKTLVRKHPKISMFDVEAVP
jgi:hypothetical protein